MGSLTYAAGGIIIGPNKKVVVVNQNNNSWSLPKGRLESDENTEQAARREIYEETGLTDLVFVRKLGSYQRSTIGKGGVGYDEQAQKHITFFLCTTTQMELNPVDPDNPEAKWVDVEVVSTYLTHPEDIRFYEQQLPVIREFLQRHA